MKTDRKTLVKALDKIVSQYVRFRDKECVICRDMPKFATGDMTLDCGHLISRRFYATRWDISEAGNCHVQCRKHNMLHGTFAGKRKNIGGLRKDMWIKEPDSIPYYLWYLKRFGIDSFEELYEKAHTITKYKDWELQEMYDDLVRKYEELLSN